MKVEVGKAEVNIPFDGTDLQTIKDKTPVVTGNLRDSFGIDGEGDITNSADYADEIELGTSQRPGTFMVERSLPEIGERIAQRAAEALKRAGILDPVTVRMKLKI